VRSWEGGSYLYQVKKHSGTGDLCRSGAVVTVYLRGGLRFTYVVGRDGHCAGNMWTVWRIRGRGQNPVACRTSACGARPRGTLSGRLVDALRARPVNGASVVLMRTAGNSAVSSGLSSGGRFSLGAPAGVYTLRIQKNGFEPFSTTVRVAPRRTTQINAAVSPSLNGAVSRIVLTWGEHPKDLDMYLRTPRRCTVFYGRMRCHDNSVHLDRDDTSSHGPETMTLGRWEGNGKYALKVHKYSGRGNLCSSGATVSVYTAGGGRITFVAGRDGYCSGNWWHVFKFGRNHSPRPCSSRLSGSGRQGRFCL